MLPTTQDSPAPTTLDGRGVAILARSLVRQMRDQGYTNAQIIGLSSELLDLVRCDLSKDPAPAAAE
jgi:hypothetical protein